LRHGAARKSGGALENEDEDVEIGGEIVGVDDHNEGGDVLAGVGLLERQLVEGDWKVLDLERWPAEGGTGGCEGEVDGRDVEGWVASEEEDVRENARGRLALQSHIAPGS
jgi:hypothetical protein